MCDVLTLSSSFGDTIPPPEMEHSISEQTQQPIQAAENCSVGHLYAPV